jgi:hypothetical protein
MKSIVRWWVCVIIVIGLMCRGGLAAWQLVDDFEGLAYGPLNGKGGWTASPEVYLTNNNSPDAFVSFWNKGPVSSYDYFRKANAMSDRNTSTVFFTFLVTSEIVRHYVGIGDRATPSVPDDVSAIVRIDTGGDTNNGAFEFGVSDGGGYDGIRQLSTGVWRAVWMVLRNGTSAALERYDVYVASELAVPGPSDLVFANASFPHISGALSTFVGFAESASPYRTVMPVWVDNIYIDRSGQNLDNPIPEAGAALLAAGAIMLRRGRR